MGDSWHKKVDWFAIIIIVVFLALLAAVSWLSPGLNLWDRWWESIWWVSTN
jgi:hypothetical protein